MAKPWVGRSLFMVCTRKQLRRPCLLIYKLSITRYAFGRYPMVKPSTAHPTLLAPGRRLAEGSQARRGWQFRKLTLENDIEGKGGMRTFFGHVLIRTRLHAFPMA